MAIIVILGVMPFAVAFITNAGSSSSIEWEDSMEIGTPTNATQAYWLENGGDNYTSYYNATNPPQYYPFYTDCVFVTDGFCRGLDNYQRLYHGGMAIQEARLPMLSARMTQTHFWGDTYVGSSGDGPFAWRLPSEYFRNIDQNSSVDRLRFTMVDQNVDYGCSNAIFENITWDAKITFEYQGERMTFDGFSFEDDNKYQLTYYDWTHDHWVDACQVGLDVEFDFTGFETLKIEEFNGGDWLGTIMEVELTNFDTQDKPNFATTALPFAGNQYFRMGIEHQEVDPVQAGFIIKSGTLVLAFGTFTLAIASTPYWSPFRNTFKGLID